MNAVEIVAQLMEAAAATAPKTRGQDHVRVKTLRGEDLQKLAEWIERSGNTPRLAYFARNAANVAASAAVVLVGLKKSPPNGLDCGACGFADCAAMAGREPVDRFFRGPVCAFRLLDLGLAIGSAVKTASLHNIDNRIMFSVGAAARALGMIDWEIAMGIPLSVTSRNPYF